MNFNVIYLWRDSIQVFDWHPGLYSGAIFKDRNEKKVCQSLRDLPSHLIQCLEFLVSCSPGFLPHHLSPSSSLCPLIWPTKSVVNFGPGERLYTGREVAWVVKWHLSMAVSEPACWLHTDSTSGKREDSAMLMDKDILCPVVMKRDMGKQAKRTVF